MRSAHHAPAHDTPRPWRQGDSVLLKCLYLEVQSLSVRLLDGRDSIDELTALYHRACAQHAAEDRIFFASYQTSDDTRQRIGKSECWLAIRDGNIVGTVTVTAPSHFPADYPSPQSSG